mgnify:CR=1 FL=1
MSDKNFNAKSTDYPDNQDPDKIINLKGATYRQLRNVNVIIDYVFCSLLQTSRLQFLEPSVLVD